MVDLKTQFESAAQEAQRLSKKPDNDTLLRLYALYKQATIGNATGKRPGFTDPVGRAKFDAWEKIKGMTAEQAMQKYIELVNQLKSS